MFRVLCLLFVVLTASIAAGAEPFTVFSGSEESVPKQPQACIDHEGISHVTFGVDDQVYYCKIEPNMKVTTRVAFTVPNMSLGMRRGPRIVNTGKAIVITAVGGAKGKGQDGDVLAYRSIDGGKNWLGPEKVNDVEASAREGMHAMTASGDGVIWCVWLDLRDKGTQLFASKSTDQGMTWGKNQLVYQSTDGSICQCCHPSIIADGESVHVLFRNLIKGNRDMFLVSSRDRGLTFDDGTRLGQGTWQLDACPMDGGMLAIDDAQKISTVWRRDRTIYAASPTDKFEKSLGTGEQPWIASDGKHLYEVWTSSRDGDLLLRSPDYPLGEQLGTRASFPIIVANAKSSVYLLWESKLSGTQSILGMKIK